MRPNDIQITQDSQATPLPEKGNAKPSLSQPLKPVKILKNKDQPYSTFNTDRMISDLRATKETWRLQQLSVNQQKSNQTQQAISSKLGGLRD
jgi:hypothetical protein